MKISALSDRVDLERQLRARVAQLEDQVRHLRQMLAAARSQVNPMEQEARAKVRALRGY